MVACVLKLSSSFVYEDLFSHVETRAFIWTSSHFFSFLFTFLTYLLKYFQSDVKQSCTESNKVRQFFIVVIREIDSIHIILHRLDIL